MDIIGGFHRRLQIGSLTLASRKRRRSSNSSSTRARMHVREIIPSHIRSRTTRIPFLLTGAGPRDYPFFSQGPNHAITSSSHRYSHWAVQQCPHWRNRWNPMWETCSSASGHGPTIEFAQYRSSHISGDCSGSCKYSIEFVYACTLDTQKSVRNGT